MFGRLQASGGQSRVGKRFEKKSDDDNGTGKKRKEEKKARSSKHIGYKEANEANESGFFFIENVFYDDLRSKNSVSLSKGIVDASKKCFIRCPGMKLDDSDEDEGGEEENGKGKENGASIKGKKKKEKIKPAQFYEPRHARDNV